MNAESPAPRPVSIAIITVLLWIKAILGGLAGLLIIIERNDATLVDQADLTGEQLLYYGLAMLALAFVTALLAVGLAQRSTVVRTIIGVVMVVWVVGGLYAVISFSGAGRAQGVWQLVLALVVLFFLYVDEDGRAYFAD